MGIQDRRRGRRGAARHARIVFKAAIAEYRDAASSPDGVDEIVTLSGEWERTRTMAWVGEFIDGLHAAIRKDKLNKHFDTLAKGLRSDGLPGDK